MKLQIFSSKPLSCLVRILGVACNPVFFVPFIVGAAYSYSSSERLPGIYPASAENRVNWDDKETNPVRKSLAEKARQAAEADKEKKRELTKSGVLAQTHSSGTTGTGVEVPWGTDVLKDKPAPISGSVSRVGVRDWSMKLFNNSEDTYSASVEVVQMTRGGKRLKSDHYSYTLKAKQSAERKFSTNQSVTDCALNLTKWKNLSSKKAEKTPKADVGAAKGSVVADDGGAVAPPETKSADQKL